MKTLHTLIGLSLLLVATSVSASEVTGTLSTGIGNSSVTGIVISAPAASLPTGTYTTTQSVTLSSSGSIGILYTVDGTTPTCLIGSTYSSAISVASSLTLKAIACYANGASSPVATYVYVINATFTSTSGGGGGGGSYIYNPVVIATTTATTTKVTAATVVPVLATTTVPRGQVLGASAVTFSVDLKMGVRGKDVLELQKFLIAQGFLKSDAPTTYFGTLTRSALIAFQKKNMIVPAVGYFGPTTRALVNKINKGL